MYGNAIIASWLAGERVQPGIADCDRLEMLLRMKLSSKGNDIQREMSIEALLTSILPPPVPWRGHKFIYTTVRGFVSTCQRSRHGGFINSDLTLRDYNSTTFNPALIYKNLLIGCTHLPLSPDST